ncbi:MAG TPA: triose-phosphate isomerase [Streptosporangiaceae bacterium]|nr:triose-phosphate isomerase [Streptosporangiaceae bacterium]
MTGATDARSRLPLIAGNWKMHGNHLEAIALVQKLAFALNTKDFEATEIAVLPPFTALRSVQTLVAGDRLRIGYGAQDLSPHEKGPYTGDVSGPMLAKLGCTYATVGHSERRQWHDEDDALVNAKAKAALMVDIVPIVCVGEGLEVRRAGGQVAHTLAQLDAALAGIKSDQVAALVIAYEPVWAIGTGEVATPQDAQEVCGAIRERISAGHGDGVASATRILYGGSVKSDNIAPIMAQADVDGALVGGASLDATEFVKICRYRELAV